MSHAGVLAQLGTEMGETNASRRSETRRREKQSRCHVIVPLFGIEFRFHHVHHFRQSQFHQAHRVGVRHLPDTASNRDLRVPMRAELKISMTA
jgi:hypothetical protein